MFLSDVRQSPGCKSQHAWQSLLIGGMVANGVNTTIQSQHTCKLKPPYVTDASRLQDVHATVPNATGVVAAFSSFGTRSWHTGFATKSSLARAFRKWRPKWTKPEARDELLLWRDAEKASPGKSGTLQPAKHSKGTHAAQAMWQNRLKDKGQLLHYCTYC
jgi:hypothetical protein